VPRKVASARGATATATASSRTARASARDMSSVKCWLAKLVGGVYIMRCADGKLVVARKRRRRRRMRLTYAWTVFKTIYQDSRIIQTRQLKGAG
jgi:hypothetical protein